MLPAPVPPTPLPGPANRAPVAVGATVTTPEDTGVSVTLAGTDPDGDPLLLLSVDNPGGVGTVAATPAGDVVYQHADDGSVHRKVLPEGFSIV